MAGPCRPRALNCTMQTPGFRHWLLPLLAAAGACSPPGGGAAAGDGDMLTAATLGEQTQRAPAEYLAEAPYATASEALGEHLLLQCKACHTFAAGAPHMVGPNLHGLFGREAGSADGFDYSDALAQAGFVWTPRAVDAWLTQPQNFLPGNRMTFAGIPYADDRTALIAALLRAAAADGSQSNQ